MMRHSVSLLLVLLFLLSFVFPSPAEAFHLLGRHSSTTQILQDASSHPENREEIKKGVAEIQKLADEIRVEEEKLRKMLAMRDAKKTSFWWFVDTDIVLALEEEQLKINEQDRVIQGKFEDALYHWKKLKPLFGVQSSVFLSELISSFLSVFPGLFHLLFGFAEFTLISFLFFGPIVFALWTLFTAIGFRLIPLSLTIYWLIWVAKLPFLLIQYRPSGWEFALVYGLSVSFAALACWVVLTPMRRNLQRLKLD